MYCQCSGHTLSHPDVRHQIASFFYSTIQPYPFFLLLIDFIVLRNMYLLMNRNFQIPSVNSKQLLARFQCSNVERVSLSSILLLVLGLLISLAYSFSSKERKIISGFQFSVQYRKFHIPHQSPLPDESVTETQHPATILQ